MDNYAELRQAIRDKTTPGDMLAFWAESRASPEFRWADPELWWVFEWLYMTEVGQAALLEAMRQDKMSNVERQAILGRLAQNGAMGMPSLPRPQSLTELFAEEIPPLHYIVQDLLHEGLWMFGGKSKRGKSWIMLDLAIAAATGAAAFDHFVTAPAPVLYLALEDGKRRVKSRAQRIIPTMPEVDNLHILYSFPSLNDNAGEVLRQLMQEHRYRLVIIDVIERLRIGTQSRKGEYSDIYEHFGPLHDLCEEMHAAIILLDHLRKQDAEDMFDQLHGTVAKQGVADGLIVLDRREDENEALLHMRTKEAEDRTIALRFQDYRWDYIGEGDLFKLEKERQAIMTMLLEEQRPMTIGEICKTLGIPDTGKLYHKYRRLMMNLEKEDYVRRVASRGFPKYVATLKDAGEFIDEVPF